MDMCIHDDVDVRMFVNYMDMLLYEHALCRWIMSMLLWDDSLGGELLSFGQGMFCLLSGEDFKHYVVIILICCVMHYYVIFVDERCKLQFEHGGLVTCSESD